MVRTVLCGIAGAACVGGAACVAEAALYDFNGRVVDVEYWAGEGANEALMVLDFGGGDSYVFGYRWDDGETMARPGREVYSYVASNESVSTGVSEAMLLALDGDGADGTLDVDFEYHSTFGFSLGGFSYAGNTIVSDWETSYAALWLSGHLAYTDWVWDPEIEDYVERHNPPMAPDGDTWVYSGQGASERVLQDGFYDGWTRGDATTFDAVPPQIVPEPAALAVLGLMAGVAGFSRRR